MNTNIEPGCLCLIVPPAKHHENLGKSVRAVRFVGSCPYNPHYDDIWEVDKDVAWTLGDEPFTETAYSPLIPEHMLMRIDGYEETQDVKRAEEIT